MDILLKPPLSGIITLILHQISLDNAIYINYTHQAQFCVNQYNHLQQFFKKGTSAHLRGCRKQETIIVFKKIKNKLGVNKVIKFS